MPEKHYYFACLDLEGRSCVVVGAGTVGLEKATGLLDAGARVTVVAHEFCDGFAGLPVERIERGFESDDLDGRYLVVAATDDPAVNLLVYEEAEERSLLCNVADVPELCSFILPAVYRQDPIAIGISTGGASPVLAQRIRRDIAGIVGPEHARLAVRLRALRPFAKRRYGTYEERRDFFRRLVDARLP